MRNSPDYAELIQLLIQCRTERGLTQPDVARSLRLSVATISNIENGVAKPRPTTRLKLVQFLRKHGYFPKEEAA
jgi:transcriptional regulator with XRE-family HTH domain